MPVLPKSAYTTPQWNLIKEKEKSKKLEEKLEIATDALGFYAAFADMKDAKGITVQFSALCFHKAATKALKEIEEIQ